MSYFILKLNLGLICLLFLVPLSKKFIYLIFFLFLEGPPDGSDGKESSCNSGETWVHFLGREDPLEREWQPTLVFLPGKSHGRRSLTGDSP